MGPRARDTPAAEKNARGQTAPCPRCGIGSVIGDARGFAVTPASLGRPHARSRGMQAP